MRVCVIIILIGLSVIACRNHDQPTGCIEWGFGEVTITSQPVSAAQGSEFSFTWEHADEAVGYYIQYDVHTAPGVSSWALTEEVGMVNSYSHVFNAPGFYTMQIIAVHADCPSQIWNTTDEFEVIADPCFGWATTPLTISTQPTNGNMGTFMAMEWDTNPLATGYIVQYDTDGTSAAETWSTDQDNALSALYEMEQTTPGFYRYRVMAVRTDCTNTDWVESVEFEVMDPCIGWVTTAPTINTQPASSNVEEAVSMEWAAVNLATGYIVQFDMDSASGNELWSADQDNALDTLFEKVQTTPGFYKYRMMAVRTDCTNTDWVVSDEFEIIDPCVGWMTDAPTIVTQPSTGSVEASFSFEWQPVTNATGYIVQYDTDAATATEVWSMDQDNALSTTYAMTQSTAGFYKYQVKAVRTDCTDSDWLVSAEFEVTNP